jgi:hypothetical protein
VDVEHQRAAGVAGVGDVPLAAGEPPDEEGVHGAEEHVAPLRAGAQPRDGVEQVLDLGAREIGVEDEARPRAEQVLVPFALQLVAQRRADAALPDDGVGHGPARVAIPEDRRLALVGEADGGQVRGGNARPGQGLAGHRELRGPDGLGVVLHLSGSGKDLRQLLLGGTHGAAIAAEDDGAAAGGALVEGQDVSRHAIADSIFGRVLDDGRGKGQTG